MMNERDVFEAIGGIADEWIDEAQYPVRRVHPLRVALIAVAAAALLGATAFAATKLARTWVSVARSAPNYLSVPSAQTLREEMGIAPQIPDAFSNGYAFAGASISQNAQYGEDGSVVLRKRLLDCQYDRGESAILLEVGPVEGQAVGSVADVYRDSEIRYHTYVGKLVPSDYQLTKQDRLAEQTGRYFISVGGAEEAIEEVRMQIMTWRWEDLNYSFHTFDGDVSADELAQMAREMIDFQDGGAR
ncbi:MAG: hypothetical protein Q4E13_13610 [Clostridia bacterium]|nr:hypothetical protein [Clostridia bacterium]